MSDQNKKNSLITEVNDNVEGQGSSTKPIRETNFGQPVPLRNIDDVQDEGKKKDEDND